ncbi:carboxypeptidase regulatory-like domain-containing protein [Sinosporangium siamense]|uniref:alpha-amylase n=1 Tax=Sinosporangium siamense TaxID=1367973 RepID=A0A919RJM0_9ACTN|nr:carboxypeptidase regulatory-like domain-containing protein [Sinosporangium siamense]GII95047.1 hypothetical protein Ssi02_52780 [Sinosporangium siamense]
MSRSSRRWRRALLGAATALAFLLPQSVAQAAPTPDKVDKALLAEFAKKPATSFIVHLKEGADLKTAATATTKADKGARVLKTKSAHAAKSQADLRSLLTSRKADFTPYWIANAVKVTGDAGLAAEIAELPQVERVRPDTVYTLPPITFTPEAKTQPTPNAIDWNLDRIGARRVWSEFGTRGEGIVVGSIDAGVKGSHYGLTNQYRGEGWSQTANPHDYNWFAPLDDCHTPCDYNSYGTFSMGIMVGQDRWREVGVAPGAKWIAAKACGPYGCPLSSLLAAGQWMLAPTDYNGQNPRPDLAPDIVNNSWSWRDIDPYFAPVVDAWVAAGIFPVFAGGSKGPACNTGASPGLGPNAYVVGAFDEAGAIAPVSGRGPGANGETKPDIAAPGVNIYSAIDNLEVDYARASGTWTAAPHVSGAVALLWSASPALRGDVAATRALLDRTAADVDDVSCGGTAAENNVWGEGRLDAYEAVRNAPAVPTGGLKGTVTSGGTPVAGASVTLTGPLARKVYTGRDGAYTVPRLATGTYQVTMRKLGYGDATAEAAVEAGQTAVRDVAMTAQAVHSLSGTVTAGGEPAAGVEVAVGHFENVITDATGRYRLTVPGGDYKLTAKPQPGRCVGPADLPVTVNADVTKDIVLPNRTDDFGHTCVVRKGGFASGTERHTFPGLSSSLPIGLPFDFPFYGKVYRSGWITSRGGLSFLSDAVPQFLPVLPAPEQPNAGIYPSWGMQRMDPNTGAYTATIGTAPHRAFIIEWRDAHMPAVPGQETFFSFSIALHENGSITFGYKGDVQFSGTTALENGDGTDAFVFAQDRPDSIAGGQSITFTPSRHGLLTGKVTDAADGKPLAGATVKAGTAGTFTTGADGTFVGQVPPGDHQVTIEKQDYGTVTQNVTVTTGAWTRADATLVTGSVSTSVSEIEFVTPAGSAKSRKVTLRNLGTAAATFALKTDLDATWLKVTPDTGELAPGAAATVTVTGDSAGVPEGEFRTGKLRLWLNGGQTPRTEIPVTLAVPKHRIAVDVGGTREVVDSLGERWSPDRAYTAGGHGYIGPRSRVRSTTRTVKDTDEQALFKRARESMLEYRFDNVPNGVYTVELGFADLRNTRPGRRVFDVLAEGALAVPLLDLAHEVGTYTATTRGYTVRVTDGQLNLRFPARVGAPIVNSIRVTERPDKTTP